MSQKSIAIQPGILTIPANQLTAGDTDFDGHGPIMYVVASPNILNMYQLGLYAHVRFSETESDWTTWEGSFNNPVYDIRSQYGFYRIINVVTPHSRTRNNSMATAPITSTLGE